MTVRPSRGAGSPSAQSRSAIWRSILVGPLVIVFWRTFENRRRPAWAALSSPETMHAFKLTLLITAIAVVVNTVFGIVCAIVIVRGDFRGRGLVNAFVDLPLSLSPVVVGFSLFVLYGINGWFAWFQSNGYEILFATPSIVLATIFVTLPFVAREVVPTLREIGDRAGTGRAHARRLGLADLLAASPSRRSAGPCLRRRAHGGTRLGEYGAVAIVSGDSPERRRRRRSRRRAYEFAYGNYAPAYGISIVLARRRCFVLVPDPDRRPPKEEALMSISVQRITKRSTTTSLSATCRSKSPRGR